MALAECRQILPPCRPPSPGQHAIAFPNELGRPVPESNRHDRRRAASPDICGCCRCRIPPPRSPPGIPADEIADVAAEPVDDGTDIPRGDRHPVQQEPVGGVVGGFEIDQDQGQPGRVACGQVFDQRGALGVVRPGRGDPNRTPVILPIQRFLDCGQTGIVRGCRGEGVPVASSLAERQSNCDAVLAVHFIRAGAEDERFTILDSSSSR